MLKHESYEIPRNHMIAAAAAFFVLAMFAFSSGNSNAGNDQITQVCGPDKAAPVESVMKALELEKSLPAIVYTGDGMPNDLTTLEQGELLIYAYNIAQADGHYDPTYLQALIWQESHAGGYDGHEVAGDEYGLRVGKRYYGVGQIKVAAAKDVFKRFPDEFPNFYEKPRKVVLANGKTKVIPGRYLMDDEEIIAYLITDKRFNIRVASKYLWIMQHKERRGKKTYVRPINYAVTAYNRGLGNTYKTDYNNWHYTVSVNEYRTTWIPKFNEMNKAHLNALEVEVPEGDDEPAIQAKAGEVKKPKS